MDHRQGTRYPTLSMVEVHSCKGRDLGLIHNISRDGMYVLSEAPVRINENVDVCLPRSEQPVRVPGIVVHCHADGFGLMFRELRDHTRSAVIDFIRDYGGIGPDPGL